MTITIDETRAVELLETVVERSGRDFVYQRNSQSFGPRCLYARDNKADCLVAQALHEAGVPVSTLETLNSLGPINDHEVRLFLANNDIEITRAAYQVFGEAQGNQDSGYTWGESLDSAKRRAAKVAQ